MTRKKNKKGRLRRRAGAGMMLLGALGFGGMEAGYYARDQVEENSGACARRLRGFSDHSVKEDVALGVYDHVNDRDLEYLGLGSIITGLAGLFAYGSGRGAKRRKYH